MIWRGKPVGLPNRLTIFRILLTVIFIVLIGQSGVAAKAAAAAVFLLASFTDFYDGYYAKKHNLVTNFGKLMDPIADKFLILTAFFIFMSVHLIPPWMFVLIFIREAVVTASRLYAMRRGEVLAAETAGKIKTVLQLSAVFVILFFMISQESARYLAWDSTLNVRLYGGIYILMLAVVSVTLFSGISFLWNNRRVIYGR